jgi:transcription elongation GreA/GreB family factor
MNLNKEEVFKQAVSILKTRIQELKEERKAISDGILEDDKSSAGDKFETGREMLTQDLRQVESQITSNSNLLDEIYRVQSVKSQSSNVREGSLIRLAGEYFLIAAAVGKISVNEQGVYLISTASPLAQSVMGKGSGDKVLFKGKENSVELIA